MFSSIWLYFGNMFLYCATSFMTLKSLWHHIRHHQDSSEITSTSSSLCPLLGGKPFWTTCLPRRSLKAVIFCLVTACTWTQLHHFWNLLKSHANLRFTKKKKLYLRKNILFWRQQFFFIFSFLFCTSWHKGDRRSCLVSSCRDEKWVLGEDPGSFWFNLGVILHCQSLNRALKPEISW